MSFGARLCDSLLPIYDSLLLSYNDKKCVQERLVLMNCMKTILAISKEAKAAALKGRNTHHALAGR